jgi:hypothetical protein
MGSIIAKNSGFTREPVPAGNYIARCYKMIEIGTVNEMVMGKSTTLHKVRIGWELPNETKVFDPAKGEQPLVIDQEYTLSMHEKSNLRKTLESWRGKAFTEKEAESFDITKLLGAPCMLNIIHKTSKSGNVYEQIAGVTPVPKGVPVPPQINKTFVLSYDDFNEELFNSLPDFIKTKMQGSLEYADMKNPHTKTIPQADDINEPLDDLPF